MVATRRSRVRELVERVQPERYPLGGLLLVVAGTVAISAVVLLAFGLPLWWSLVTIAPAALLTALWARYVAPRRRH